MDAAWATPSFRLTAGGGGGGGGGAGAGSGSGVAQLATNDGGEGGCDRKAATRIGHEHAEIPQNTHGAFAGRRNSTTLITLPELFADH